jgi:hypothetical protein
MVNAAQREEVAATVGGRIFDSTWVRRLDRISFLGPLDAHSRSRRASSRLEHSIGVAALGSAVADTLGLEPGIRRAFVTACLLHDIGHYPLSHAAEPAFVRALGASHHDVSRYIILGEGPIARVRSLAPVLEGEGVDPQVVWALIDGKGSGGLAGLAPLLRAPINLDTLEGITRVARDFRVKKPRLPSELFVWCGDEIGLAHQALDAADAFWVLKDRVYDRIINLPSNVLVEARLVESVASAIDEGVFDRLESFDDAALLQLLGERATDLGIREQEDEQYELRTHTGWGEVLVRMRKRYEIDASVVGAGEGLPLSAWTKRWRHRREPAYLISKRRQLELPLGVAPTYETPEFE